MKSSRAWDRRWELPMRGMAEGGSLRIDRMVGVYLGDRPLQFDGLDVLPVHTFLEDLHAGRVY